MKTTSRAFVVNVPEMKKIENSDSLSFGQVDGYNVVMRTADWQGIKKAIFIPPENIVDVRRPEFSFLRKKDNRDFEKVKVIRLRGVISAGVLIPAAEGDNVGDDVTERLGIVHDDPEAKFDVQNEQSASPKGPLACLPKYDIDSFAKIHLYFKSDQSVVVTEKIHGCLKWDTLIETHYGKATIDSIKVGDKVLSYNVEENKYEFVDVLATPISLYVKSVDWYKLTLENGKEITITGEHLVLTERGYVEVKNLTEDDEIFSI